MDRRDDGADDVQSEDSTEPKNGNREKLAADADDADAADAAETARWSPPWRRPGAAGQSIRPDRRHLRVFRPESAAPTLRTLRLGHPLPPLTLLLSYSVSLSVSLRVWTNQSMAAAAEEEEKEEQEQEEQQQQQINETGAPTTVHCLS